MAQKSVLGGSGYTGFVNTESNFDELYAAGADAPLKIDGTAGRTVRSMIVRIEAGTNADTIKVTCTDNGNSATVPPATDNIAKADDLTNFEFHGGGAWVKVKGAGLAGDAVYILSCEISDAYAKIDTVSPVIYGTITESANIYLLCNSMRHLGALDMTTDNFVDFESRTGFLEIAVTYLTDA